jgi:hypothetical protein
VDVGVEALILGGLRVPLKLLVDRRDLRGKLVDLCNHRGGLAGGVGRNLLNSSRALIDVLRERSGRGDYCLAADFVVRIHGQLRKRVEEGVEGAGHASGRGQVEQRLDLP